MLHLKRQRFKKKIALLLASVSLVTSTLIAFPITVMAGDFTGGAGLRVTVTSLKVTSSPVEEENNFTIQAKYHAEYTNHGWDETVWSSCGSCGGSGSVSTGGGSGGAGTGGGTIDKKVTCGGKTPGGGTFKCRPACDGWDYNITTSRGEDDTGKVTQKPGGGYDINWGGAQIGTQAHPCDCSTKMTFPTGGGGGGGSGGGSKTCPSCDGSGGSSSTVHHPPAEPPSTITVPAVIMLDGKLLEVKNVTFELHTTQQDDYIWTKEGDATVDWIINAGENIGNKDVTTEINGGSGNGDSETIVVDVKPACDLAIRLVDPQGIYIGNTTVITSFEIKNNNSELGLNVRPKHKMNIEFVATDKSGRVLYKETKTETIVPKNRSQLVYFKWTLPNDLDFKGKDLEDRITLTCKVNTGYIKNKVGVNEDNFNNNMVSSPVLVAKNYIAEPFDVKVREETPPKEVKIDKNHYNQDTERQWNRVMYSGCTPESERSWNIWTWEKGNYKLNEYSASLSTSGSLTPDVVIKSNPILNPEGRPSIDKRHLWVMRSGYGYSIKFNSQVKTQGAGFKSDMVTSSQSANCYFPEYNYSYGLCDWDSRQWDSGSKYRSDMHRSLVSTTYNQSSFSRIFEFDKNRFSSIADPNNGEPIFDGRRIHYTPLWYPDTEEGGNLSGYVTSGEYMPYKVNVLAYNAWTPVGMLSSLDQDILGLEIKGTYDDDWHYKSTTDSVTDKRSSGKR